ncbi:DNA-binding barrel domain superfamily [Sesbania bispinosa]|nr:DNA-binding barrel domain superfamily [Sesbania bispinosa]
MDPSLAEYIRERQENFTAKVTSTQNNIIINGTFYSHWETNLLNSSVTLTDPAATHPLPSQSTQIPERPLEEAHNRSPVNPQTNDEEENVNDEAGMLLWRARITKAIEGGKQGAVIPKRIVTEFLEQGQQVVHVMLPQGAVQPWALLWNTILHNHCKLGQGWYQFCREESLKKGDEVSFWKFNGEQFWRIVVNRANQ